MVGSVRTDSVSSERGSPERSHGSVRGSWPVPFGGSWDTTWRCEHGCDREDVIKRHSLQAGMAATGIFLAMAFGVWEACQKTTVRSPDLPHA